MIVQYDVVVNIRFDSFPRSVRAWLLRRIDANYPSVVTVLKDQALDRIDANLKHDRSENEKRHRLINWCGINRDGLSREGDQRYVKFVSS